MIHSLRQLQDKLQRQWETCRQGVTHCQSNDSDRTLLLNWLERHPTRCHSLWIGILEGEQPDLEETLLETPRIPQGDSFWRRMVTSSPFGLLNKITS